MPGYGCRANYPEQHGTCASSFWLANLFTEVPLVHSCHAAPPSLTLRLEHPRTPSPLKSIISLALSRLLQPLIRLPFFFICFAIGLLSGRDLVIRACLFGPCCFVLDIFVLPLFSSQRSSRLPWSVCLQPVPDCLSAPIFPTPSTATVHRSRSVDDAFPTLSGSRIQGPSAQEAVLHTGIGLARPHTADIGVGLR